MWFIPSGLEKHGSIQLDSGTAGERGTEVGFSCLVGVPIGVARTGVVTI